MSTKNNIAQIMAEVGAKAKTAARPMAMASSERKHAALISMAEKIWANRSDILNANVLDVQAGEKADMSKAMLDRLNLTENRIKAMVDGILAIAELPDPVGHVMASWERPNGLQIDRVRTPLGVIGVIYESRPNVTADAGALCLKSGNAVILRGGSDSYHSSRAIHAAMTAGLKDAGLPEEAVQMVPTTDRAAVGEMLKGLNGTVDVIVPRGGKGLVGRVQSEARVPVFAHLEGLVHIFIAKTAGSQMVREIVINAKLRRTGICGSAETLLFDRNCDQAMVKETLEALHEEGCEIRADAEICSVVDSAIAANDEDWQTEYLDAIISARMVNGIDGAIEHIAQYSSNHTDAILSEDAQEVERFFNEVDSAILIHNASTQFADGGEFGMGAEIGIATGKMHARGPVGLEQLTSFNYRVRGNGQIRPK